MKLTNKQRVGLLIEMIENFNELTVDKAYELFKDHNKDSNLVKGTFNQMLKEEFGITLSRYDKVDIVNKIRVDIATNDTNQPTNVENIQDYYKDDKTDLSAIDEEYFIPYKTNSKFDTLASRYGGVMKGTTTMISGESGAGKTVICTNIGTLLKAEFEKHNENEEFTLGFLSGEMDKDDWTMECLQNKKLCNFNTIYLLDYINDPLYLDILKDSLKRYKFCVVDSFEVICEQLSDIYEVSKKKAESMLIDILRNAAKESGSILFIIQQFTKGGTYVGSTKIKHLFTASGYVKIDKDSNRRYFYYEKNRRNGGMVFKNLYFDKNEYGEMIFDAEKFEIDNMSVELAASDVTEKKEEAKKFDELLQERKKLFTERDMYEFQHSPIFENDEVDLTDYEEMD